MFFKAIIYFNAIRPKTLIASVAPVLVGAALAYKTSKVSFSYTLFLFSLFSALCIQIGTNLFNDYLDFKKGGDGDKRVGPKRLAQHLVKPVYIQYWAVGFFILASILAIPLIVKAPAVVISIGAASLFFGYLYTGSRWALAYTGMADFFVIAFFGIVAVGGTYYLQTMTYSLGVFLTGLELGMLCCIILVINNLRDIEEDSINNKNTLVVRFGENFGKKEIASFIVLAMMLHEWTLYLTHFNNLRCVVLSTFARAPYFLLPAYLQFYFSLNKVKEPKGYTSFLSKAAILYFFYTALKVFSIFYAEVKL
ncbi:MAG: 1,4-dihydroxy-2-naphthoate octaprenyltransferase [Bdellovibrionaceae bacterium]|nr:1,4-dihydroxy-2-naphthoate octaprenyltransferase [Pseudobdellovibrionaceae bacterium]